GRLVYQYNFKYGLRKYGATQLENILVYSENRKLQDQFLFSYEEENAELVIKNLANFPQERFVQRNSGVKFRFVDLNSDGKPDLLSDDMDVTRVQYNNGEIGSGVIFSEPFGLKGSAWQNIQILDWTYFMDLTGDGKLDYVNMSEARSGDFLENLGNGNFSDYQSQSRFFVPSSPKFQFVIDVNGDGLPDVADRGTGKCYINPGAAGQHSTLSMRGSRGFLYQDRFYPNELGVVIGDFNGDGLTEIGTYDLQKGEFSALLNDGLCSWKSYLSIRLNKEDDQYLMHGFEQAIEAGKMQVGDLNGDGLDDFVLNLGEKLIGVLNVNGKILMEYFSIERTSWIEKVLIHDIDGDGFNEVTICDWDRCDYIDFNLSPNTGRLVSVKEINGGEINIEYKGSYEDLDMNGETSPFRKVLVKSIAYSSPFSMDYKKEYTYKSLNFDKFKHKIIGFSEIREYKSNSGKEQKNSITYFNDGYRTDSDDLIPYAMGGKVKLFDTLAGDRVYFGQILKQENGYVQTESVKTTKEQYSPNLSLFEYQTQWFDKYGRVNREEFSTGSEKDHLKLVVNNQTNHQIEERQIDLPENIEDRFNIALVKTREYFNSNDKSLLEETTEYRDLDLGTVASKKRRHSEGRYISQHFDYHDEFKTLPVLIYDDKDQVISKTVYSPTGLSVRAQINGEGEDVYTEYDEAHGLLKLKRDANNVVTKMTYDERDRLLTSETTKNNKWLSGFYSNHTDYVKETNTPATKTTVIKINQQASKYKIEKEFQTASGNVLQKTITGPEGVPYITDLSRFDGFGRSTLNLNFTQKAENCTSVKDCEFLKDPFDSHLALVKIKYDNRDRPTEKSNLKEGTTELLAYGLLKDNDGEVVNSIKSTDKLGMSVVKNYAYLNRLKSTQYLDSNDQIKQTYAYQYSPLGFLSQIQLPSGLREIDYYDSGLLKQIKDQSFGQIDFEYDYRGRLDKRIWNTTHITKLDYDLADRILLKEQYILDTSGEKSQEYNVTIKYGNDYQINNVGLPEVITTKDYQKRLSYNPRSQVKDLTQTIFNQSYSLGFEYDDLGQLKQESFNDGLSVSYKYDSYGYLKGIDNLVDDIQYGSSLTPELIRFSSGLVVGYNRSKDKNLIEQIYAKNKDDVLFNRSLRYNQLGHLVKFNEDLINMGYSYTPDSLHMLSEFTDGTAKKDFDYDDDGFQKDKVPILDEFGRVKRESITYGSNDRIEGIKTASGEYKYIYDENNHVVGWSGPEASYINLSNTYKIKDDQVQIQVRVGTIPLAMVTEHKTYPVIVDQLNSPVVYLSKGQVKQRVRYKPYGEIYEEDRIGLAKLGFENIGLSGGVYEPHSGLYSYGVRHYDPKGGHFTTKDPLGLKDPGAFMESPLEYRLNSYALNSPLGYVDPSGEDAYSFGQSVSFQFGTFGFSGSLSVAITFENDDALLPSDIGIVVSGQSRTLTAAGIGGGIGYTASFIEGAQRVKDLSGLVAAPFVDVGPYGGGALNYDGKKINGISVSLELPGALSLGVGLGYSHAFGVQDVADKVEDILKWQK
ncbi:MAG: hypothetical protein KDD50_13625, partial [Bdellovibrionales bacterium]|nr:hypothetical protein [Bdellovibrionales bacterium]